MKTRYADIHPYVTKDGSQIRELMHPDVHGSRKQSLAEALLPAGATTKMHTHSRSEELYHVTSGRGVMTLGNETFDVEPGDTVLIPPGTSHCLENTADTELRVLCCCAPGYSHDDTHLKED